MITKASRFCEGRLSVLWRLDTFLVKKGVHYVLSSLITNQERVIGGLTRSLKIMKKKIEKDIEPAWADLKRASRISTNLIVNILCHLITLEKHLKINDKKFREDYLKLRREMINELNKKIEQEKIKGSLQKEIEEKFKKLSQ